MRGAMNPVDFWKLARDNSGRVKYDELGEYTVVCGIKIYSDPDCPEMGDRKFIAILEGVSE